MPRPTLHALRPPLNVAAADLQDVLRTVQRPRLYIHRQIACLAVRREPNFGVCNRHRAGRNGHRTDP